MPSHINKSKTAQQTLKERFEYFINPDKTDNELYINGFKCDWKIAALQFNISRKIYKLDK